VEDVTDFQEITKEELKKWMDEGRDFVLIDTLGPESYKKHHLPGAKMIDAHEVDFVERVKAAVADRETPIVVYCASFECQLSPHAAKMLADAGFSRVYDYEGGIADWKESYPLHEGCTEVH
jgi:rhodanese-related sulfurtransferase